MNICLHEQTEIRWRSRAANLIGHQCLACRRAVGGWLKHSDVDTDAIGDWLEDPQPLAPSTMALVGLRDRSAKVVERDEYEQYLGSLVWRRRREKVMQRAGGQCEGCLSNQATDVHHLTYAHVYAEFAFELIALCRVCHERVHDLSAKRAEAVV